MVHVAEALRQIEGTRLERNDWVGRDTWLGSASPCVELNNCVGSNSTFVEKSSTNFPYDTFAKISEHKL